jgi:hypothetical protein
MRDLSQRRAHLHLLHQSEKLFLGLIAKGGHRDIRRIATTDLIDERMNYGGLCSDGTALRAGIDGRQDIARRSSEKSL